MEALANFDLQTFWITASFVCFGFTGVLIYVFRVLLRV